MNENTIISTIVYTFLAFTLLAVTLIIFYYFSNKKITRNLIQKKELEVRYEKDLTHAIISAQEKERLRIAQDLHDDISSKLSVVSLNIHLLDFDNLTREEYNDLKNKIIHLVNKTAESARQISHDLLPPILEKFGLHAAIDALCSEINLSKTLQVTYSNSLYFAKAEEEKNLHIFRILQELINNSIKHGESTHIDIEFLGKNGKNTCIYKDDGKGFNLNENTLKEGLGLRNIRSRVELINGTLKIESENNKGITVEFTF
ncbi:signal transduction histidine kinase [Chryseobacterium bernardetii]|jgi:signal transduction histidine kinase|uniref:histidine kinase n=3 Tax=Chryseobacterium TaxID=59732 RepID=A0A543EL18_9FLAO|nr:MULTISPECIES: ATP-binding protein [Chryseobacterium]MDR6372308.1 signal transduction histidine kinase [Chryseobacterium vietnamense]MDR6442308.1 signal transduction histidine kinase [Chryseobacterium bernardetii]MDR6458706.1 signal transduction histidine kinase [Chryseobacterium vietnamense]MDR6489870.1 signal transduction histidine kinase [Chryseobacterium vietnamense]TQM22284.1 signal transduction histidine kinase [Chryseobacterium aquifrigidense]